MKRKIEVKKASKKRLQGHARKKHHEEEFAWQRKT
jgi:hypothetical protein